MLVAEYYRVPPLGDGQLLAQLRGLIARPALPVLSPPPPTTLPKILLAHWEIGYG